ncbi:MAG: tyrosine--tRNA ligase [Candidatus Omnitrophica bacterium]|nr:tyrosine--tRNA ligase [Candidatus Omnitrophota bacterium]MCF7893964.1 tyrosine--tRNA ligase [Candidatus Omnitrophota bacterium]
MNKDLSKHLKAIEENTVDLISPEQLEKKIKDKLKKSKPLKIKIGFDPTACDIHIGHTVLLNKLRKLQDLGHIVYFIIGDFTAKIGDPSGKIIQRPVLDDSQIRANASTYTKQAFKILNKRKTKIIYNSRWYKKMNLSSFLSLLSSYTVARILERDDFSKRIQNQKPLSLLEVIYPLIQGYDSYKMEADIEFGGTDQKFNLLVGRNLQQFFNQPPQIVATMPLLVGLDGQKKMSKSLGNYIGITEKPKDMFGKIMSVPDEIMWDYIRLLTDFDLSQIKQMHPKDAKVKLAKYLVSRYYSKNLAEKESKEFQKVFSERKIPEKVPIYKADNKKIDVVDILSKMKLTSSKNEARRLLNQGSITMIDSKDPSNYSVLKKNITFFSSEEVILKVGKKRFLKIVVKS